MDNGCWNCAKCVHITNGSSYVAMICKDNLKDVGGEIQDMSKQTCENWVRKWRDQETCPFFRASEYDVNGDREERCMFDNGKCDNLGCMKGENYSENRIKHHIAIIDNYQDIADMVRQTKAQNISFDELVDRYKAELDRKKGRYVRYIQEMRDIESL